MKHLFLLTVIKCAILAGCVSDSPSVDKSMNSKDCRLSLDQTIGEIIKLLENKKYNKLFNSFINPEIMARLASNSNGTTSNGLLERFRKENASKCLETLKSIRRNKIQPSLYFFADRELASYFLPRREGETITRGISFIKINGKWYIEK